MDRDRRVLKYMLEKANNVVKWFLMVILVEAQKEKKSTGKRKSLHLLVEYINNHVQNTGRNEDMCAKSLQLCPTPWSHVLWPTKLYYPWGPLCKNNEVSCHALLWGIFPNQGSNSGLPYSGKILYHLCHQGSPRILEWVVYPFSRGSSWPRNQTRVSCIAGGFFTSRAHKEAPEMRVIKSILVKSQIKLRVMLNELRT